MKTRAGSYDIRAFTPEDEPAVLDLLRASLGGGPAGERPAAFFRWKHLEGPFGPSFMVVADTGEEIIGLRAFLRWEFVAGARVVRAVRAVDTATHPDHQGRGVFSRLTSTAIERLGDEADFIFNTPNDKSLPGYLKLGWQIVERLPVHLRIAHPLRFGARAAHLAAPAEAIPGGGTDVRTALDAWTGSGGVPAGTGDRLATERTRTYLRWRYADAPLLTYRALATEDGLAIWRPRRRGRLIEATVTEVLADEPAAARRLLREVRRASGADHLAGHAARGTVAARAIRGAGGIRVPGGPVFVARPLRATSSPDPTLRSSWALTAGDLEVF